MQDIIRAQQLIDESKSAQLVIQHIELAKLKQSINERCTLLKGKGLGRHLTDKVFILSVEMKLGRKRPREKRRTRELRLKR